MRRKTLYWIIGGVLALGCLALGIGLYLGVISIPPISQQLSQDANLLSAQIVYPPPDSTWPLNSFVPIRVTAQGAEPIRSVELYINNVLLSPQEGTVASGTGQWSWQPGAAGVYVLTAKATARSGAVSLSDPVRITADEAAAWDSLVIAEGGETLAGMAQEQGIPLDALQAANPAMDPAQALEPGKKIFVPNAPAPVVNEHIIQPLAGNEEPDSGDAGGEGGSPIGNGPGIIDNLQFMQGINALEGAENGDESNTAGKDPVQVPMAPELAADFANCAVKLTIGGWFYDPGDPLVIKQNEDGFFVYRSRDGGDFERIYTVGPIHDSSDDKNRTVVDPDQYGDVTYYVSAFNVLGESDSNPVTLPLGSMNCSAPARAGSGKGQIGMQDGNLILPYQMDLAYLYLQINGSKAVRVPEGNRMFLPSSGVMFNLLTYLDGLGEAVPATDVNLHMEVWGWSGGSLIFVGEFDTLIHRTVLMICSVPGAGSCAGGTSGQWVTGVKLPQGDVLKTLEYDVRWQVSALTSAEKMGLALAAAPFTGDAYNANPQMLWASQPFVKGSEGTYVLKLGEILYPVNPYQTSELGWGENMGQKYLQTNGFSGQPIGLPFTLYLRANPIVKMQALNDVSNVVVLAFNTALPPSDMPPLASPYDSIYGVEILEETYQPPGFYDPELWGCVVVDEDPTGQYPAGVGHVICPGKDVAAKDDCAGKVESWCLVEGLGNALAFVWDQFVTGYEAWIHAAVTGAQSVIPGCSGSDECKTVVKMGVEAVWKYLTGLPADLPSSDEVFADSAAELIVESAIAVEKYYTGLDDSLIDNMCKEDLADCKKRISDAIKEEMKKAHSIAAQKTCIDAYQAYFHGREAVCLDPRIIVHEAPNSANLPASVMVRVTRQTSQESIWVPETDWDKYKLMVWVDAASKNPNAPEPLSGPLYETALGPIPWLEPGESVELPVALRLLGSEGSATRDLYFGETTASMKAVEACYSPDSSWDWVPCENGGQDTWVYDNPAGLLIEGVTP